MSFLCERKMRNFLCYIVVIFFVLSIADGAFAGEKPNIHIGALEIHPFTSLEQTYDSNIYLEPEGDENNDFITDIGLGVGARMPLIPEREEDFMIEVSYKADIIAFWDHHTNSRVDHTIKGLLDCKFANDFQLVVKEDFERTADPPNSERISLDKRYKNVLDTELAYNREKITLASGYTITRNGYKEFGNLDRTDNMFTGACFYQIFPKTSVFTEYNFGLIEYDDHATNSDSIYHQVRVGLKGDLWPKITGTVKTGYKYAKYDESDKEDFSGFTLLGEIKYDVTERTVMHLYAERTSEESSYASNSYFETNVIGFKVEHQLLERLWFNGDGSFRYNRYPTQTTEGTETKKRKDILWGIGAGLKYEIKEWMLANTGYEFKQRDSKFSNFDYDDHRVTTRLLIMF